MMIRSPGEWMLAVASLVAITLGGAGCDGTTRPISETSAPADSIRDVVADPDAYARARRFGALLPSLGPEAVPEVREALGDAEAQVRTADFDLLLRFWAVHEPEAASHWAVYEAFPLYRIAAISTTFEILAEANPATAVRAVQRTQAEANREAAGAAEMALVRGWFRVDRSALEQYIRDLGIGKPRQRAAMAYALSLQRAEGSDALMRWAESVEDDESRYKLDVFRQVTSALTQTDMDAAVRWCDAQCDGPWGNRMRTVIVRARLRDGELGSELIEWAAAASEQNEEQLEDKRHTIWLTFATWASQDRDAALEWMRETVSGEPEPWVAHLYAEYGKQLARGGAPAEGIAWAERVEDEQRRHTALIQVGKLWCQQDATACASWLESSPLTERERKLVRKQSG